MGWSSVQKAVMFLVAFFRGWSWLLFGALVDKAGPPWAVGARSPLLCLGLVVPLVVADWPSPPNLPSCPACYQEIPQIVAFLLALCRPRHCGSNCTWFYYFW